VSIATIRIRIRIFVIYRYSITVKISRDGDHKVIEVMTSTESLAI
jgi:hypothetical protein